MQQNPGATKQLSAKRKQIMANDEMDVDAPSARDSNKKNPNVTPSASADEASKDPDMNLSQEIHKLTMIATGLLEDPSVVGLSSDLPAQVMKKIAGKEVENPYLYRHLRDHVLKDTPFASAAVLTEAELTEMEAKHEKTIEELEKKVVDARDNAGDMEVLVARFEVARFSAKSMSKEAALEAYDKLLALPKLSTGKTIDATMESARVASFHGDSRKSEEFVEKAGMLSKDGGDWDRRNRLKVYNALCKLLNRDVKGAAGLLIDCISTFSCTELCSYNDFILYAALSNILYLPRTELKSKIVDGPEILSIKNEIPVVYKLVSTLYECDYNAYLNTMVELHPVLVADRFLQPHAGYILRELHVLGYKQFLDSYKSVTLQSMASSFGVSPQFLDLQLSRFIAAGRLTAKIDKFGGVVETTRPDLKNAQYRDMIQKGDLLLNRIQKLARVVDL